MRGDAEYIALMEIVARAAAEAGLSKSEARDLGTVLYEEIRLHPRFFFISGNIWEDVDMSVLN